MSLDVPRERVVAVVATLPSGRIQVGSGYLVTGCLVVTAEHCTRDKLTGDQAREIRVVRATDAAELVPIKLIASTELDIALLSLPARGFGQNYAAPVFARVNQEHSGRLTDCVSIGFPLFQYDTAARHRGTAELHGVIYQTDEAESGRLLMREPLLTSVTPPAGAAVDSAWGGLSGAVVFHAGQALGIVIEHHPQQSSSAVQLASFSTLAERARAGGQAAAIADAIGLPKSEPLPLAGSTGDTTSKPAPANWFVGAHSSEAAASALDWESWSGTPLLSAELAALEVLISPSGRYLAIAADDGTLTVARHDGGVRHHLLEGRHLQFTEDETHLLLAKGKDLVLTSIDSGAAHKVATVGGRILGMAVGGQFVLVASSNSDENLIYALAHATEKPSVRYSDKPDYVLTIVDLRSGEISEHASTSTLHERLAITADGGRVAVSHTSLLGRASIDVTEVATWQRSAKLRFDKKDRVSSIAFHPDTIALAAGTAGGRVDVFTNSTATRRATARLEVGDYVRSVGFSRNGRYVVVATNGSAQLWQVSPAERLGLLSMSACRAAAWADGCLVAVGAELQGAPTEREASWVKFSALPGPVRVASMDIQLPT